MVTERQIAALKYLINISKGGDKLIKRILFLLIDASNGFTKPVSVTFFQGSDGYTGEEIDNASHALTSLKSSSCSTHLDQMMILMGLELRFSTHYGNYDESGEFSTEGMFQGVKHLAPGHENDRDDMPIRYTFWLGEKSYGHPGQGRLLETPAWNELMKIDTSKSGLYPDIEGQEG